jgi:hypothetical protein
MMVCYVEVHRALVGKPAPLGVKKLAWREMKGSFHQLFGFVADREPGLRQHETDIKGFHEMRNGLYHSGLPLTVPRAEVLEAASLARDVQRILFGISYQADEWSEIVGKVGLAIAGDRASPTHRRSVSFELAEGLVRFSTEVDPSVKDAIGLVLHGHGILTGTQVSIEALAPSLRLNGIMAESKIINTRLAEMRRKGLVSKTRLDLTPTGLKDLKKRFIMS